ncbi:hypothetical protein PENPOL_c003G04356 [Penicillium polonicum]|uniref:NB-ARC domain-containing protein n=1 Tax=Penicillium polonicum TaxID=60169 RepID=A0A1V6NT64_PENPO|nr:hypothetical protein PENPOL_c003G04356 [Penicillium polonicum]
MSSLSYLYICCGCGDGPKVYNLQPICITCSHQACANCYDCTTDPGLFEPVGICLDQAPSIAPEVFVGRDRELDEIAEHLNKNTRLVLGGIHGVGKTQVARAYAESRSKSYSSVLWLNAASENTLNNSLQSIANLFDPRYVQGMEDYGIIKCVDRWLSHWKNEGWLLIFDGYDEPSEFDITRYYPSGCKGNIIITTRRPDLIAESTVHIKPFHRIEDSLAILQTRSKRENVQSDLYAARLAKRLAGLPLALVTTGMYLRRSVISFEKYLEEYDKRWNSESHSSTRHQEYGERTIQTILDLSYAQLEAANFEEDPEGCHSDMLNASSSQGIQSTVPTMDIHEFPAIDILVRIFMEDRELAPLYREGLFESCTTPSSFVRELKRLLKRFAVRLKEESVEAVDIGIANFVASRPGLVVARIRSQCGQQRSQLGPASTQRQGMAVQNESQAHPNKDSNEPDGAVDKNDATIVLQGLSFIEGSTAFQKLREEFTDLVKLSKLPTLSELPEPDQWIDGEPSVEVPSWLQRCINFISFISLKTLRVELKRGLVVWGLNVVSQLETSVPENHQRFRWMTRHGKVLFDDYVEHEPGALQALQEYLITTTVPTKATSASNRGQSFPRAPSLYSLNTRPSSISGHTSVDITDQSTNNLSIPRIELTQQDIEIGNSPSRPLFLLSCIERRGRPVKLHQELITHVGDDRELFHALRRIYHSHRRPFESFWSLRTLHSIHFMKPPSCQS